MKRIENLFNKNDLGKIKSFIDYKNQRSWVFHSSNYVNPSYFFASNLKPNELLFLLPNVKPLLSLVDKNNDYKFLRGYINCNPPTIRGDWHIDDGDLTVLYYPMSDYAYINEGGTEFLDRETEPYINNSALIFPAHIKHRSQDHNNKNYRFSFAFKFALVNESY